MQTLSPTQERARIALDLVANIRGLTNVEIGKRTGLGTSIVQARRKGVSAITLRDLDLFAEALDVPVELFQREPAQIFQWFADQAVGGNIGKIVYRSSTRPVRLLAHAA